MKQLLLSLMLALGLVGCVKNKPKEKLVIDMGQSFIQMNGDSVWRPHGRFVSDSEDTGMIRYGRQIVGDTSFVLKNLLPVVIIFDNGDTARHWFGDTIRYTTCNPIHKSTQQ